jgi:hypothetical protein
MPLDDQEPQVYPTREQAAELGLPGADRMCTYCGTYGATYLRHLFLAGYGVVQLCPTHEATLEVEMKRHQEAMRELTTPNFKQEPVPATLRKPAKPWQESMHAREIRELAAAHGLTVRQGREKSYELVDSAGDRQFFVAFNSRNEFQFASTRDGVHFASDGRSNSRASTPRQLLNMFRQYVDKHLPKSAISK